MIREREGTDVSKQVLFAVLGMSPAVLTETVWALAHEPQPIVPDEIVTLTTTVGREAVIRELFRKAGWRRLCDALAGDGLDAGGCLRFGPAAASIRLFPAPDGSRDLADLTTAAEHETAADLILQTLRGFTEDPSTRVIASLAGGRRTTSALLLSCMSLLARPQDRLCHVLVNPPYDSPQLEPLFLFPEPEVVHRLGGAWEEFPSVEARIELVEVPFVRMRPLYRDQFRRLPPSYSMLVRQVERWSRGEFLPEIEVDVARGEVRVGGRELRLSAFEFAFFLVVARRISAGRPWRSWIDVGDEMEQLRSDVSRKAPEWLHEFAGRVFDPVEDPRKLASVVRRKLDVLVGDRSVGRKLLPNLQRRERPSYAVGKLKIVPTSLDVEDSPRGPP